MTARSWILALGLALLACTQGCIILSTTPTSQPAYARCTSSCDTGTACIAANTTVNAGSTSGELFCSTSCVTSNDCPAASSGTVTCVNANGSGQCYRTCTTSADCGSGFTCGGPPGMQTFCVPGTTTASCGASGQACCAGSTCNSGLVCGTSSSGAVVCGVPAATCGASGQGCCAGNTCNSGLVCGVTSSGAMACGVAASCGGSGQACCTGNTCNSGLVCGVTSGGAMACGVPAGCGTVGDVCCSGNTCSDAGAACGSDGHCGLAPYSGCGGSSLGASCLGGQDSTGGVVATTCQQTMIANPGPNGFCTALCAASAAECPQWVGATRTYSYNCYILQGTSQGQCFIDCPNGEGCPANTICSMTANSLGQQVRLCMPMPG